MRYLLVIAGLCVLLFGIWAKMMGNPNARPSGEYFIQLGAIILAIGFAAIDIVEAINAKRQSP